MASLSDVEAANLIKTPKNGKEILKAKLKRQRHRLHSEPEIDTDMAFITGPHHIRFLEWVKRLLKSEDNYERFRELYRPPLATNELVEAIFSQFEKVFESENKYEKFNFTDSDLEIDAADYRKAIGDLTFWETQGFETLKNSVDNVLIVDLPRTEDNAATQAEASDGNYPQPYYYFLDIDNLIDIKNVRVKAIDYGKELAYFFKTEYVVFWEDKETVCVFDDTSYRVFAYSTGKDPVLLSTTPHDLGYCPARSFWTTPMNSETTFLKRSPITNSISQMDWYLAYYYFGLYLKMYAPFPIYAVYKGICNYKDPINKVKCFDGYLYVEGFNPNMPNAEKSNTRCPRCNKIKTGPGNILELKAPQNNTDPDLLRNPVKVIPAEEVSVKVVNEELDSLWDCIFENCVGGGLEVDQTQAKNQDQVQAAFESKTNTLLKIKRNFEVIHTFAMDTVYRLRYGDKYISGTIDYGDVFFQKDESQAMDEYVKAKEQQLPAFDLAIRRNKINETKYRNNPDMIQRLDILSNLDPFPDDNVISMAVTLSQMPESIDPIDLCIKVHFNDFVARFEREQASLLLFGASLSFDVRIKTIRAIIEGYATDYLTKRKSNIDRFPLTPPITAIPPPAIRTKGTTVPVT